MNEELKVIISAEIGDLKNKVNEAKSSISSFVNDNIKDMDKFKSGIEKAGEGAKKFLKTSATAIAGVGTALVGLAPATKEYREGQGKLATAFEDAGKSADVAKGVYNDLYRVLGDSDVSVEAANHLAQLSDSQEDLSEWTKICEGIYASFGDSLPIEGLTEAANETAKVGDLTGSLADALNWAGVNEDDFQAKLDACNTEAEREALIRETLSGLYDDAADKYEENAKSILDQNEAQAQLTDNMAKLGEATEPIMTMLTQLATDILSELTPHITSFVENHGPQLKEILEGVAEKIGEVIGWIADHWELVSTVAVVVGGIAAAIALVSTALTVYNTVMAITAVVSLPMIGVIALIVAGIAALVAIIVLCVKHWDEIKEAAGKAVDKIKEVVGNMVDKVKEKFEEMKKAISEKVEAIKTAVKEKFDAVKTTISEKVEAAKNAVKEKFEAIKTAVKEKTDAVKNTVSEKFTAIKEVMSEKISAAKEVVSEKFSAIKEAVSEKVSAVKEVVSEKFSAIKEAVSEKVSTVKEVVSEKFSTIASTMKDKMSQARENVSNALNSIKDKFSNIIDKAKSIVKSGLDKIKGFFNFKWELPKLKLPHFKISGKFSLDPPSIPKFSVNWYAKGGIFDKPTLFPYGGNLGGLGEAGAEAIVPLEKNTQWLDRIAERLASKQGSTPIILQVDGKTFAQTAIGTINQLTRQTGTLGLNII